MLLHVEPLYLYYHSFHANTAAADEFLALKLKLLLEETCQPVKAT
jgi:hypothetical protein